jgi:hypothetical protein
VSIPVSTATASSNMILSATDSASLSVIYACSLVPVCICSALLSRWMRSKIVSWGQRKLATTPDEPPAFQAAVETYDPTASMGTLDMLRVRKEEGGRGRGRRRRTSRGCLTLLVFRFSLSHYRSRSA